jgi:hypothetical protein
MRSKNQVRFFRKNLHPVGSYFSEKTDGKTSKLFILLQRNSDFYGAFFKSYNIPEVMIEEVKISPENLANAIKKDAQSAVFSDKQNRQKVEADKDGKENFYE